MSIILQQDVGMTWVVPGKPENKTGTAIPAQTTPSLGEY